MGYKEFATKTFWGRFVNNMIFVLSLNIIDFLHHVTKSFSFDWNELFIMLGVDIVLALVFAALGFSIINFSQKGKEKKE